MKLVLNLKWKGLYIIFSLFQYFCSYAQGISNFKIHKVGDLYGVIDNAQNTIISAKFEKVVEIKNYGFIVIQKGLKGFYDYQGNEVLKPLYDSIEISSSNISASLNGRYGLFGVSGNQLLLPQYQSITLTKNPFIVLVKNESKSEVLELTSSGYIKLLSNESIAYNFDLDRFLVSENGKIAMSTYALNKPLEFEFEEISFVKKGFGESQIINYFLAKKGGKWGVFDVNVEKWLISPEHDEIEFLHNNRKGVFACKKNGKIAIITGLGDNTTHRFDSVKKESEFKYILRDGIKNYFYSITGVNINASPVQRIDKVLNSVVISSRENSLGVFNYSNGSSDFIWFEGFSRYKEPSPGFNFKFFVLGNSQKEVLADFDGNIFRETESEKIDFINKDFVIIENGGYKQIGMVRNGIKVSTQKFKEIKELPQHEGYFICDGKNYFWSQEKLQLFNNLNFEGEKEEVVKDRFLFKNKEKAIILDNYNNIFFDYGCISIACFNGGEYHCFTNDSTLLFDLWGGYINKIPKYGQPLYENKEHYRTIRNDLKKGVFDTGRQKHIIEEKYYEIDQFGGYYLASFFTGNSRQLFDIYTEEGSLLASNLSRVKSSSLVFKDDTDFYFFISNKDEFIKSEAIRVVNNEFVTVKQDGFYSLLKNDGTEIINKSDSLVLDIYDPNYFFKKVGEVWSINEKEREFILKPYTITTHPKNESIKSLSEHTVTDKRELVDFIPSRFFRNYEIKDSYYSISTSDGKGLLNKTGNTQISPIYESINLTFSQEYGLIIVVEKGGKFGLFLNNKEVLPPSFEKLKIEKYGFVSFYANNSKKLLCLFNHSILDLPSEGNVFPKSQNQIQIGNQQYSVIKDKLIKL